jgi:NAD(P)-dependent dehydrogenase (short-subunit alcohol dehydrogenase family)
MPKPIGDQVIVVTGASSGIGRLTAIQAAAAGARVVLAARNAAQLESVAHEIVRLGGVALAVPTDVTDMTQVQKLADRTLSEFGRLDSWIGNAGVALYGSFDEISLEEFRRVMDVNFMGQVYGARASIPLLERTAGSFVCVGSALSDRGVPLQGAYCASKHALKGWLDSLRVELKRRGSRVRVSLIKPSSMNTPLFNKAKTYLGVMPRPIAPIYEPELAADVILRAAEGRVRDAFVGGSGKLFSVIEHISPKLLDLHQLRTGFDSQRSSWPKAVTEPNNIWEAVEYDGGVHGDFTPKAKLHSAYTYFDTHSRAIWMTAAGAVASAFVLRAMLRGGDDAVGKAIRTNGKVRRIRG